MAVYRQKRRKTSPTGKRSAREPEWLTTARKRFNIANEAESDQKQRELDDLRFYAGDQWPEDVKNQRKGQAASGALPAVPARPMITINKAREPVRHVLNQAEQSEIGIELVAADDFGDVTVDEQDETEITLREGLTRRIQRESEATSAYMWAFKRAVIAGRGYFGIMTRYLPGKTWDQEVYVQRFYNQSSVTLDPSHEEPDGSDAAWGFVGTFIPLDQYTSTWPSTSDKANRISSATEEDFTGFGEEYPDWFTVDGDKIACRVVDYYYTVYEDRELVELENGESWWADELPKKRTSEIADRRTVAEKTIKWCKIDGLNPYPLEQTDWPGQYLPIVKVLGEELHPYDDERRAEGMVRPAREPNQGFNYMVSKWVEAVGLAPIPTLELDPEQIEGFEDWYKFAATRTLPYLPRRTWNDDGLKYDPIKSTDRNVPIAAIAGSVQLFDTAIKSTTGVPDATLGNVDPSLRSGKAVDALVQQSRMGTSNFMSNLVRSLTYGGKIINDLIYPIYGKPGRIVKIITAEGKPENVQIQTPDQPSTVPQRPKMRRLMLTDTGRFNIAVNVTKNFDTRRQQESVQLGELIGAQPQLMGVFGDLFFQNQDGPGHQEMAERAKVMLDPKIQAQMEARKTGGAPQVPPQMQQQMQMAQQVIEKAQQEIQELQQQIATDQVKQKAVTARELAKADITTKKEILIQTMKDATTIAVAKINALTKGVVSANEAQLEQIALNHEAEQSELSRQHDLRLGSADAGHDERMGQMGHEQAVTMQAMQPQPTDGAVTE